MRRMFFIVALCFTILLSGCSVYMAHREPKSKRANVMTVGTPRIVVLGELGKPVESIVNEGGRSDIFSLTYEYGTKSRETCHARDMRLFAVGLWQFADPATREDLDTTIFFYQIDYDTTNRVKNVTKHAMGQGEESHCSSYQPPA